MLGPYEDPHKEETPISLSSSYALRRSAQRGDAD